MRDCINESLRCRYEGCERLYKSKAGLVRHESMMHWKLEERMRFVSESCDLESSTKGALISHWRTCETGSRLEDGPAYFTVISPEACELAGGRGC